MDWSFIYAATTDFLALIDDKFCKRIESKLNEMSSVCEKFDTDCLQTLTSVFHPISIFFHPISIVFTCAFFNLFEESEFSHTNDSPVCEKRWTFPKRHSS